ncbi:MAG: NAD-dependent epimerase/dehydratase family protein [Symploca sp. SIO3E6]|nr:NAD-dependent epimerase/dehydratase family protein [Caldora sp. SIO3E6]
MATSVDVIYHSAASVQVTRPYAELKAINVLGTQEVIRLAGRIQTKPLHFISTLGLFIGQGISATGAFLETDFPDLKSLKGGYKQTKAVAELLVQEAQKRGLPACIYRPGRIIGHSQTGIIDLDTNIKDFLFVLLIACVQMQVFPVVEELIEAAPVDYFSRAILQLAYQESSFTKVKNNRTNSTTGEKMQKKSVMTQLFSRLPLRLLSMVRWSNASLRMALVAITLCAIALPWFFPAGAMAANEKKSDQGIPLLTAFAWADVDLDGDLDAIKRNRDYNNWLWLNDGAGLFTASQLLTPSKARSIAFAFGDLDNNGYPDLVVANRDILNQVWLNDGMGHLQLVRADLGNGGDGKDVALEDFDGDGDLDVIFANVSYPKGNGIWFNDGAGNLESFSSSESLGGKQKLALGDIDGDGDIDAVFAKLGDGAEVWFNDGYGDFTIVSYPGPKKSWRVKLADLDGDGDLDVVFGNEFGVGNEIWLNDGSGAFTISQSIGDEDTKEMEVADLDADGDVDVIFANNDWQGHQIWLNDGTGHYRKSMIMGMSTVSGNQYSIRVKDIDGDSDRDVVFSFDGFSFGDESENKKGLGQLSYWLNQASQGRPGMGIFKKGEKSQNPSPHRHLHEIFIDASLREKYPSALSPFLPSEKMLGKNATKTVGLGDLDGDGDKDLVFPNSLGVRNEVWFNDGVGNFSLNQLLKPGYSVDVGLGDLNGDGTLDVVFTNRDRANEIWFNNGSGQLDLAQSMDALYDSRGVALGDLDEDGDLDIVFSNAFAEIIKIWLNDGSGFFTASPKSFEKLTARVEHLALGDLDLDGDLDMVFINGFAEGNEVWFNGGSGDFTLAQDGIGNGNGRNLSLGDLDADGDLDAIFVNTANQGSEIWLNDGWGHLSFATSLGKVGDDSSDYGVALADLDGDGDLDAVIASRMRGNGVWLNDGMGRFLNIDFLEGHNCGVGLGDINGDGRPDVIFTGDDNKSNTIWFSNPNFTFAKLEKSGKNSGYSQR